MKHSFLSVLALSLLSIAVSAQSFPGRKKMDEKYGFRDGRFESNSTTISGLAHVFDAGVKRFYRRPADKLTIGTGDIKSLYYVSVSGKLAEVVLTMDDVTNANAVFGALKEAYGLPRFDVDGHNGQWTSGTEIITYDSYRVRGEVVIKLVSKEMMKVEREAVKKAGKQAASDL